MKMDFSAYKSQHYKKFNINQSEIEQYWLDLHNLTRKKYKLAPYSYNSTLNNTAIEWSYNNYDKGKMDHKRSPQDGWYNYNKIENWFQER